MFVDTYMTERVQRL